MRAVAQLVLCVLALAAIAMLTTRRGVDRPTVLWTEDTELDKMTMAKVKMCCSQVTFPCCMHEACCDGWLENGLDQEPQEERGRPVQLFELSYPRPAYPIVEE